MSRETFFVRHPSGFFFRVCGYGLTILLVLPSDRPLFTERTKLRKFWRVGRYKIGWLHP